MTVSYADEIEQVYLARHGPALVARAAVREYASVMTEALTVGRGISKGTPVDTGSAESAWTLGARKADRSKPNRDRGTVYPVLNQARVANVFRGWRLGQSLHWLNQTDYVPILEGGRRPDRNGRMIGSIQAPDGWIEHSQIETESHMRSWRPTPAQVAAEVGRAA